MASRIWSSSHISQLDINLIARQFPDANNSKVDSVSDQSAGQFATSSTLIVGLATFGAQIFVFLLLKDRLARIYQPRTYLVPPRERTEPAELGWFKWTRSVLSTPNSEFLQKCGPDAYFFLRYLRTLLKIFVPAACVILPVLIPLNTVGGKGNDWALTHPGGQNVTGLNQLSWGNVQPNKYRRYWGHWSMATLFVIWICYVSFDELKNYIRMRQAYITSPQHRLRASATTVLVSAIPPKWNNVEALDGLFDVFPGGIRNIWINRNFDELSDKVKQRDKIASQLEGAETDLIKKCFHKNEENIRKAEKAAGQKLTKDEKLQKAAAQDEKARQQAEEESGVTAGDPHQVRHTIADTLDQEAEQVESSDDERDAYDKRKILPVPILGDGLQVVTDGLNKFTGRLKASARNNNHDTAATPHEIPAQKLQADEHRLAPISHHDHQHGKMGAHFNRDMLSKKKSPVLPNSPRSPLDADGSLHAPRDELAVENDQRPLNLASPVSPVSTNPEKKPVDVKPESSLHKTMKFLGLASDEKEPIIYPAAFSAQFEEDDEDAVWRKYITEKERDTFRLPIFGWQWMFSLPGVGKKVDTIYYCRKELARLNVEIEDDQANPERFPLMNSAFIQFNHQVAAHMACQSIAHHLPKQMAPRMVEIDPKDVIWDNMAIPWWQNYVRTALVLVVVAGMIILWAIPVAFTGAVSQLNTLADEYTWMAWVLTLPAWVRSLLQGVLPIALLGLLMWLLPVILRALSTLQGTKSGMMVELAVQKYYFFFIFIQLFLIVTIGSSLSALYEDLTSVNGIANIPNLLGTTIPTASNYFFSYMLLQALSVSSGALLQIGSLVVWFVLAPLFDNTARAKFKRQTNLSNIQWGTFFPVYTNLACIGIIYSVVAPLILIFNIITFSMFWFVYRYNTLYVTRFTQDTGGLLYPNAINCTFVGVYVMELALIGLFFLVRDEQGEVVCEGQAIGMIVVTILTALYQILLNNAFSPLFRYLPITLEDDAVRRDEEFTRAMRLRHNNHNDAHEKLIAGERTGIDIEDQLEEQERRELADDKRQQAYEMQDIAAARHSRAHKSMIDEESELSPYEFQNPEINMDIDGDSKAYKVTRKVAEKTVKALPGPLQRGFSKRRRGSWADRDNVQNRRSSHFGEQYNQQESERRISDLSDPHRARARHSLQNQQAKKNNHTREISDPRKALDAINAFNPLVADVNDLEAQRKARAELSDALYSGVNDELEDLSPEQRDALVQRAFQHSALRARRPVIWIPRDELGVSDDEVRRIGRFAQPPVETKDKDTKSEGTIWVSNVRQGLDSKGRCVYSGAPPDFSEVDLIQL